MSTQGEQVTDNGAGGIADEGDQAVGADRTTKRAVTTYLRLRTRSGVWAPRTAATYSDYLIDFTRTAPARLGRIREHHVVDYVGKPRRDGRPASHALRRIRLATLRGFFAWCAAQRYVRIDPAAHVSIGRAPRRVPRDLSAEEVAALICDGCTDRRDLAIIVSALQLGMRRIELVRWNVEDIDWRSASVLIHGKGGIERSRPLTDECGEVVNAYLAEHPATDGPLFRSYRTGRRLSAAGMSDITRAIFERSGVKRRPYDGKSLHACRHTMISDVLAEHGPWAAKEAGGHESWSAFSVYARGMISDELREAMEGRRYAS